MISVSEIMTPDPFRLTAENTIGDAHVIMDKKQIHHIPIVDADNQLIGLVSHRDILAASGSVLRENPKDQSKVALKQIMVTDVFTATRESSALKAAKYIHDSRHGCLPVINSDKEVVGILTEYDFVEVAISLLERRKAKDYSTQELGVAESGLEPMDLSVNHISDRIQTTRSWD